MTAMFLDTLLSAAGPDFTAVLDQPHLAGTVSALIATYNRCPFDPAAGRLRDNSARAAFRVDSTLTASIRDTSSSTVCGRP